ncbi:hypothetical protein [Massilia sp.]|uniref:hypothetical protein n=1 Tax=Massilia sp. TaxID=1882437 RepID=UPI0028A70A84|nr:hypothetical protein [Massilia sp.]
MATIGTLGILLTLAVKFRAGAVQREASEADSEAGEAGGEDDATDAAAPTPGGRRACPHRRARRRLFKGTGR